MPEVHYIKHLREIEGLSINEIVEKTGRNWRTVKKYADGETQPTPIAFSKKGMMYEEGFGEIVDDWLEEDGKLRRKDRRTNKKIHEDLRDQHGFKGSYRTVCEYIQHRKPQLKEEKATRYERLEHPPGEAQVDFGEMTVVKDGNYKDIKLLILSFPYSNAGFACPMPGENTECFLEGLKRLFHQAGGVPTHLRIDNLSAAVATIGKGDQRTYTDAFLAFQNHYRFEVQACNPASGHEKGNVEKKVGYTRNNLFTVSPIMESFAQMQSWVEGEMAKDRQRMHYEKGVLIEELWQEDQKKLKTLPLSDLPVYSVKSGSVNNYGEIEVDKEKFVVHKARAQQRLLIKMEWDRFTCLLSDGEIVYQSDRPYMNTSRPIPWKAIFKDWVRKPRSVRYSRFFQYLPDRVRTYLTRDSAKTKARAKGIQALMERYTLEDIENILGAEQRLDREPHELGAILEARKFEYPEGTTEPHTPAILVGYETDLSQYDQQLCPALEGSGS